MDESESLDALANILTAVAEKPYDVSIHGQHIRLAQSLEGMESEVQSAMEMMVQLVAAGDEVWLPLLTAKEQAVDLETEEGVQELLEMYARAENDYLSIPILQKHLKFLVERHALYASAEQVKPEGLGEVFSTAWTREAINNVVKKGVGHLTESFKLWDVQRDWEMEMLEASPKSERPALQPHPNIEESFQTYSSFTTNYLPPQEYESILISASKVRGQSIRNFDRRERLETNITNSGGSLEAYHQYIGYERRAKYPDIFVTRGVHERAISEAAKRRFSGEPGSEEALRVFWTSYLDALRILDVDEEQQLEVYRRAVRSVPGSGEAWARYIRFLEHFDEPPENLETILVNIYIFAPSFSHSMFARIYDHIEQLAPLVLARAGYEKRRLEAGNGGMSLIRTYPRLTYLEHLASKSIDPKVRLEKFLAPFASLIDNVFEIWKAAAKHSKSSYQVWLNYTDALIKHQRFEEARQVFLDVHSKQLDWPEALWEAWLTFEHVHGSVEEIETALDKIESAQYQTNMRRAKEAANANAVYEATQAATTTPMDVSVPETAVPTIPASTRSMEEELPSEGHKKPRIEQKPPPLKRDRENSTVFVADLPQGVTDDDLKNMFKDCGNVREVKITQLSQALVATVEFFDRDSVPAALTKDKKRLRDQEISVHLAWRSTLYVTNFPESADDAFMRDLFGKYGTIFDVRWPSKKFKTTRRFCYVQFTLPEAAQKSLELHGRELEPNLPLNVYISNPERRKERTDQDANEREVYVAGLSRFTTKADLEKLFATYGPVKDVRIALEDNGHAKGFAFVEFEDPKDAQSALAANNHELKKRRIAVTLADPRVRARHKSEIGLSRVAEARNRSVRIKNLPAATQEGLLQQVLEKIIPVKRLEVFIDKQEAVVELENPADAGRLLLRTEPIVFGGNTLELSEDVPTLRSSGAPHKSEGSTLFKPRRLGPSKPKAGLGFKKAGNLGRPDTVSSVPSTSTVASSSKGKGQDDFRKMLEKK
ncbi:hypothetical protein BJ912DRAFT_956851 [Pholiota molesta]|nr:hypothetical protein BJ912DRAFT_956851 [Pholiota molesta]